MLLLIILSMPEISVTKDHYLLGFKNNVWLAK
jgi:hypothetical protein